MRVAIVGCGLIGRRRAQVLKQLRMDELVAVADVDPVRAQSLASEMGCEGTTNWRKLISHRDIDAIVVSTVNKFLMPITVAALEQGKHVLCEKPLGRNSREAGRMVQAARANQVVLKTGFNHRHHPAIEKARELCSSGTIGPPMFIRCVYGHGGRAGYDKEWRADAELAGGGVLLDQGVHIVDLCRWFLGDFSEVFGRKATCFWELGYAGFPKQGSNGKSWRNQRPAGGERLEDNAFAILRTSNGRVATIHTSWTQWKNRFAFELFGRDGYLLVDGLGGSYGAEKLTVGRRRREFGPPDEELLRLSGPDLSWQAEWKEFGTAIREDRQPLGSGEDGLHAMQAIDAIYRSSRTGRVVRLESTKSSRARSLLPSRSTSF